jgi:hypothetical protein
MVGNEADAAIDEGEVRSAAVQAPEMQAITRVIQPPWTEGVRRGEQSGWGLGLTIMAPSMKR